MASTIIKFAGGVSARDAHALGEMRCKHEFVQSMRKQAETTEFACWSKNTSPQANKVDVPLGIVSGMPKVDLTAHKLSIGANRTHYCSPGPARDERRAVPRPPAVSPSAGNNGDFELGTPERL